MHINLFRCAILYEAEVRFDERSPQQAAMTSKDTDTWQSSFAIKPRTAETGFLKIQGFKGGKLGGKTLRDAKMFYDSQQH